MRNFPHRFRARPESFALALSLLVHLLALYLVSREDLFHLRQPPPPLAQAIDVRLLPPVQPPAPPAAPVLEKPPLPPVTLPARKKTAPEPAPPAVSQPEPLPQAAAVPRPEAPPLAPPKVEPPKPPAEPAPLDPSKFPDMSSYMEAVRARRRAAGQPVDAPPGEAPRQISEDEARLAQIQRNLQQTGTNGIFQITSVDRTSATFNFRGWRGEYSYARREEYQVEVGFGQDIRRAVVRKMIEIIRRYYPGDFNWESIRLGRIVVLSARIEDNDGLEDFLMQEFFGGASGGMR